MKKTIAILIAALMLISMIPVNVLAANANECKVVGDHTKANCAAYTLVETIAPEACKFGYTLYSCDACGTVFADDFIRNDDGHIWETVQAATAATCTDPAKKEKKVCSVCDETHPEFNGGDVEGSKPIGGAHEIVWGEVADCTVEERIGTCSKCGITQKKRVDTHNYGTTQYPDSYVAPTCTEEGSASFKCKDCDHVKTLVIDALGHDGQVVPSTQPESCEKPGNTAGEICVRCNTYITAPEKIYHSGTCEWEFVSYVIEPTCTDKGTALYECTANDNPAHTKVVDAEPRHTYEKEPEVIEATCTTWGFKLYYCIECGDLKPFEEGDKIAPLGHNSYDEGTDKAETGSDTCEEGGIVIKSWTCGRVCAGVPCAQRLTEEIDNYKAHAIETVVVPAYCHQVGFTVSYCTNPACVINESDEYLVSRELTLDLTVGDLPELGLKLVPGKDADGKDHDGVYAIGTTKDATKHDVEEHIINDATCTSKGAKYDFCPNCSYMSEVVEIPVDAHDYSDEIVRGIPVVTTICGGTITTRYICSTCGIQANDKVVVVANPDVPTKHTFDEANRVDAVEPTCKTKGRTSYIQCNDCATKSDDYKILNEVDCVEVKMTQNATCVSDGKIWYECKWCETHSTTIDEVKLTYTYEPTKTYATFADAKKVHPGLTESSKVDVRDGDCTKIGLVSYECEDGCGKTVLVVKASVDGIVYGQHNYITDKENADYDTYHDDAKAPTCQNVGYTELFICIVCGYENGGVEIEKVDHEMVDYACGEGKYCKYETDGCEKVEGAGYKTHNLVVLGTQTANCLKIGFTHMYCDQCGEESLEKLTNFAPANGHDLKDKAEKAPTCVTPGNTAGKYCAACDYKTWTVTDATGAHKNKANTTFYDKCTDKTEDRYCTVCKDTIAQSHTMVPGTTVEPDCNNEGYKLEGCVDCGFKQLTDYKPKTAHTMVEIDRVDSTVLETGLITYQCSVCKADGIEYYETEVIDVKAEVGIALDANNANGVAGKTYTDSSLVALTITLDAAKTQAWGVAFDLYYSENLQFVSAEFSANNKFVVNAKAVDNNADPAKGANPDDYVSISAFAPNAEDKTLANETIEGKMEFVTLYFRVTNGDFDGAQGATASANFWVANAEVINTNGEAKSVSMGTAAITIGKFMDYNDDGDVALADILAASKILSGELTVEVEKKEVAVTYDVALDVDKDGEITAADLLAILDYINGAKSYADVTALK